MYEAAKIERALALGPNAAEDWIGVRQLVGHEVSQHISCVDKAQTSHQ
jgi:hypothetical protein